MGTNGRKPPPPVRTSKSTGKPVPMTKGCLGSALAFLALPVGALLPIGHFLGVY